MSTTRIFFLIILATALTGCASTEILISAAPLESVNDARGKATQPASQGKTAVAPSDEAIVHELVQDSQDKCAKFVTDLFARIASVNTKLDISSLVFSTAATIAKPLNTIHVLSGASAISTGAKTAISLEYLNSVTISHISQSIQSTYTADMSKYIKYLSAVDPSKLKPYAERSTILSFHNECSLPAADGSILSALQPVGQQPPTTSSNFTYKIDPAVDKDLVTLAKNIASKVNGDKDFQAAKVTASADGTTSVVTFTLPANHVLKQNVFVGSAGKTATEIAKYSTAAPQTITITGTLQKDDTITIEVVESAAVKQAGSKPTPAILGQSPQQKALSQ